MTNTELYLFFKEVAVGTDNIFDIHCQLLEEIMVEKYENTEYFKATGNTILEAYDLYLKTGGKMEAILNTILTADYSKVDFKGLLEQFSGHFNTQTLLQGYNQGDKDLLETLLNAYKK